MTDWWTADFLLLPSIVAVTLVLLVTNLFSSKTLAMRLLVLAPILLLGFRYLGWRITSTLNLEENLLVTLLSLLMLGAEVMVFLVNTLSSWVLFACKTNRTPEADEYQTAILSGRYLPTVDVFIPTVNEPPEILRRTITGCQNMDYPHKTLHLLDDGRRPEVEALAREMGVHYYKRDTNEHFKAGNVNNALWKTHSELIAFFDADFVPTPQFLTRTVGFFQNANVALIQTPQCFYNPDLIETNLGLQNGFTNEQDLFFRSLQPGRDAFNAVICCGTSFVLRRQYLEDLGGMPTDTITEDLMTSVYFQAKGYQVVYLNEALSFGEAPNRSVDHLKQRVRWARGIMQTLFTDVNPLVCQNLSFFQRFYHMIGVLYWTTTLPRLIILLMPLSFLLFDLVVISAKMESVLSYFLPFYLASMALFSWYNSGRRSPFWSDVYELVPTFHLIPNILSTFANPFGLGFKVTPKGVTSDNISVNWDVVMPCTVMMVLYIIGWVRTFIQISWGANLDAAILNLIWSGYAIALLWMAAMACVDVPQKRTSLRFHMPWRFELKQNGAATTSPGQTPESGGRSAAVVLRGDTLDVSEKAVRVRLKRSEWEALNQASGQGFELNLPQLHLNQLPVTLRLHQSGRRWVEVLFYYGELPQPQYAQLIRGLFTRLAEEWETYTLSEWRYLWHFIRTPLRLYPFAR